MRRTLVGLYPVICCVLGLTIAPALAAQGTPQSDGGKVIPLCQTGCLTYGVSVSPKGGFDNQPENATGLSYGFIVANTGSTNESDTYTVKCTTSGPVVCDSLVSAGGPLGPLKTQSISPQCFQCGGGSTTISLTLTGGTQSGVTAWAHTQSTTGSGTLTVTATGTHADADHGWDTITVTQEGPPTIALINNNPNEVARDLCFTSGAGAAAGVECGDLFVVHGMPAYRTMGKDRSLILEYNSSTATGKLLVPVAVTEGSGTLVPTSVKLVLTVGTAKDSATFNPPSAGITQQMVLGRGLGGLATGVYPVTLAATNQYADSFKTAATTGQVLVVNRSSSAYGRGWGLDGVEQLILQPDSSLLWTNGDGSARLYARLNATTWVAPAAAFRDTIVTASGRYTRYLRHGVRVVFDASGGPTTGLQIRTFNRIGDSTTFNYTTIANQQRLTGIVVPPNDGITRQYHLYYNATTALLDSIVDPGGRRLKSVMTSGQLTSLTDPDGRATNYVYSPASFLLTRQVFPRPELGGSATFGNVYTYANGFRITKVQIPAGEAGTDTMATTLTPWDERGLAAFAGATGQSGVVYAGNGVPTLVDGPVIGTGDQVQAWVNAFGQPTKTVLTGTGATTTIVYGDPSHPALATQVTSPTNLVNKLHYNARGNLDTLWQSSPDSLIGLPNRRSTWVYGDANTPDGPTQVKDPLGRTATYAYTSLGLTDSVIDSRGHHTDYGYVASGAFKGIVDSVVDRQVSTWRQSDSTTVPRDQRTTFVYDSMGNVKTSTSPISVVTSYVNDSLGRVTDVYDAVGTRAGRTYDVMNRVLATLQYTTWQANPYGINPLATCDGTQVLCADSSGPALVTDNDTTSGGSGTGGGSDTTHSLP
ncbi:MAG TPA: hypothetical protein VFI39_03895, partial [Gemmatimonadales bacterium]|nr:hypothetical protein [Gemmatimonadales bacterium]